MLTVIVYAKTIVIVVIIIMCLIPSKLKMTILMKLYILYPDSLRNYLLNHNILFSLIFLTFFLIVVKISDPSPLCALD